jgi:6-phosphogluconolactonase (cycloisomerase 2 family)
VANPGSSNISAFSIDSTSGALTQISGSPFDAGSNPVFVVLDASSKSLYVGDQASTIYGFSIDSSTGALSGAAGFPYSAGSAPSSMSTIQ